MLSLLLHTGGRPFAYDDIEVLQNLALAGTRLYAGLPNCVVSGCRLTPSGNAYDVGSGFLWLDDELRYFPGRAGVTLPALFQVGAEVRSDNRVNTLDGLNKPTLREQNAELVDYDPANPPSRRPLLLTTNGPLMWWHRIQEKTRAPKEIQYLADYDAADYDANGVGIGAAWGWALCDGRGGRPDLGGRFATGRDAARADYDTVGKTGGAESVTLTVPQIPSHEHTTTAHRFPNDAYWRDGSTTFPDRAARSDGAYRQTATVGATGGGQAHENRPPYYVLNARMWVGLD